MDSEKRRNPTVQSKREKEAYCGTHKKVGIISIYPSHCLLIPHFYLHFFIVRVSHLISSHCIKYTWSFFSCW